MNRVAITDYKVYTKEQLAKMPKWYKHIAECRCPKCDSVSAINKDKHTIDDDGMINPSYVCPYCDFHEWVYLENYKKDI